MIRDASIDDVPRLVAFGRAMMAESPHFRALPFSAHVLETSLTAIIESSAGLCAVAEHESEVAGVLLAFASPHWAADCIEVSEMALYVDPPARKSGIAFALIERLKQFAHDNGAAIVRAGASAGIADEQVARLYELAGFKRCGLCLQLG